MPPARADVTLVGGFSPVAGYDEQALARRAGRAREAGSPLLFAELDVALDTPGESAASRLARLNAAQAWPPGDRVWFAGPPGELTRFLAGLAAHVDGMLFYPAEAAVDLPVLSAEVLPALAAGGLARLPGADEATRKERRQCLTTPHLLPSSLADIVDKVVPELQDRGVYRTKYEGTTPREHLALPSLRLAAVTARQGG